jgi:mono/diheme cytochrome c family protein
MRILVLLAMAAVLYAHDAKGEAPDLGGHHVHGLKDGELYWIITNGAGRKMPGFAKHLSEVERWRVVNYVRTLHK